MLQEISLLFSFLFFMVAIFSAVYLILTKPFSKRRNTLKEMGPLSGYFLCIAFVLIIFSFYALSLVSPYFISYAENIKEAYEISSYFGNAFSGITTPFIAISAVIVTGLAFYMQFQANQQIRNQFKVQQFETQFYEMIRLHRENLNEMKIEGYTFKETDIRKEEKEKQTTGKKIFITMISELNAIYTIIIKIYIKIHGVDGFKYSNGRFLPPKGGDLADKLFRLAYGIFFGGIVLFGKRKGIEDFEDSFLKEVKEELEKIQKNHRNKGIKEYNQYIECTNICDSNRFGAQTLWLSFNYRPFSGHQSRLAHYYRHLYMSVKYVVKQPDSLLTYEKKREYLRLLRAQLSNHEQVLLYYNWLVGYGESWEEKEVESRQKRSSGNYFFTDYRMIHNLNPNIVLEEFDPEKIFDENYRSFKCERRRGVHRDTLFEIITLKGCTELLRPYYN